MTKKPTPSKVSLRFFRWYCHPDYQEDIEGDLRERFDRKVAEKGAVTAKWGFFKDVIMLFRPGIIRSWEGNQRLNHYGMFRNYFKVGVRNILKYKVFSFINVFGLAVAMSVCMLIILMLADQKSYDRFHEKKDRVYRILLQPKKSKLGIPYATGPFPMAASLKTDYPIIEEATHLAQRFGGDIEYEQKFAEVKGYFTDATFFRIFSYELERGDRHTALEGTNSMVVTHEVAHQLFGDQNPIGKSVNFTDGGIGVTDEGTALVDWGTYTINGVLAKTAYKTHLQFDVLISSPSLDMLHKENKIDNLSGNWIDNQCYTYVLLQEKANENGLKTALDHLNSIQFDNNENLKGSKLIPQALTKITPGPLFGVGNAPSTSLPTLVYYILSGLALVVMISACLNYTNLSVARTLTRTREIGIRKVNGAKRRDLIFQFMSESMITALLSLAVASVLLLFVKLGFKGLWLNKYLGFDLDANIYVYLIFLGFALVVGLIAGIFPALRLSKYRPAKVLGSQNGTGVSRSRLRKVLTVTQFVISLLFIVTSVVIYNQFGYIMNFDYGFNAKNVVNINLQGNDFYLVKNKFGSIPGISGISGCAYLPATGRNDNTSLKMPGVEEAQKAIDLRVDENFLDLLEINLIAGRNLSSADIGNISWILVNEETARVFGYDHPTDIVGASFDGGLKVVGVFQDLTFHPPSSGRHTGPIILRNEPGRFKFVSLKIESEYKAAVIARLQKEWKTIDPAHPLKYNFYDDELAGTNQGFSDVVSIIGFIAFLAITISCLGLLGIAVYITERRTKEVGIRKVMGAGNFKLVFLLSKEFLIMLGISILIAAPLSHFLNSLWLNFLANRVAFGFGTVFLASMFLLILGLLTIGPQTFRVSNRNPVNSLRDE